MAVHTHLQSNLLASIGLKKRKLEHLEEHAVS